MLDMEKIIKELHNARRYLEDKEWSDRGASPHIDAINDTLALLKEQPDIVRCKDCEFGKESCGNIVCHKPGMREYESELHPFEWFCADGERK